MIQQTLQWAAQAMKAQSSGLPENFCGVSTDTRQLKPGQLFFCLKGKRDGHDYAEEASQRGAAALVIEEKHKDKLLNKIQEIPLLIVSETLKALGDLAHAWRQNFSIPILAITGSHGKTTTKDLAKTLLAIHYKVHATQGNFNNLIGVPKTLFELNANHQVALIEMGMNDFGEIARLTQITRPTAGLITRIGEAHLEKLKDLKGVARAKGELFINLEENATALINLRDPWIAQMPTKAKKVYYGTQESNLWGEAKLNYKEGQLGTEVIINELVLHPAREEKTEKEYRTTLPLIGSHHLDNILSALAIGKHLGISIKEGLAALKNYQGTTGRMEALPLEGNRLLFNDAYNANPQSMEAALSTLQEIAGEKPSLAILGSLAELGEASPKAHIKIGQFIAKLSLNQLMTVGPQGHLIAQAAIEAGMTPSQVHIFKNVEKALSLKEDFFKNFDYILLKGSRINELEKLISKISPQ